VECKGAIKEMGDIVIHSLDAHYLTSAFICGETLKVCKQSYVKLNVEDYIKDVLKDKVQKPYPKASMKKSYKILQITDPHVDSKYIEGGDVKCGGDLCCRTSPQNASALKAGYWGTSEGNCDIPI